MALRLRTNPAPTGGALYVSNPRRRKRKVVRRKKPSVMKRRMNRRKRKVVRKKKTTARKNRRNPIRRKRKSSVKKRRKTSARKNRRNPVRRKRKVVRRKRKNGLALRKNRRKPVRRKRSTRKGMRRKTARRAYMKRRNPSRKKVKIVRKNPMALTFLKPVEKLVSKIPVIGKKVAPYTQPAIVAMVGGAGNALAMRSVGAVPYADKVFGHAFGYTVMGLALAGISAFLPVKSETKKALAISFAAGGGAINAFQLASNMFDLNAVAEANKLTMGVSDMAEIDAAVDAAGLGDGMYYEVEPMAGIVADMSGYEDAEYGDALSAPSDLSPLEGQAAMMGQGAYFRKFGMPPRRVYGIQKGYSQHAGKRGHRWGWLIKSLGFERFSKLAAMPPQQRRKLIAQMKAAAIQAAQSSYEENMTGAYQGLAVDMNGLAVDNMAGLAVTGAGI